eukprot:jgi/Psemu1/202134/e_gw1.291.48.1
MAASNSVAVGRQRTVVTSVTALLTTRSSRHGFSQKRAIISNSQHRYFFCSVRTPSNNGFFRRRIVSLTGRTEDTNAEERNDFQQREKGRVPQPTWSVKDLELTSPHTPIPKRELGRLARLVLVDLSTNKNNNDLHTLFSLEQDLGNMLHMIQHVTEYDYQQTAGKSATDARNQGDTNYEDAKYSAKIYDTVRGIEATPLRKGIKEDPLQEQDAVQAQDIWASFLQTKAIRVGGGHVYFSIKTTET